MRNILWKLMVMITAVFLLRSIALAQGISGFFDINKRNATQYDEGERTSYSETFNRTLYLNANVPITRVLSYQMNLRTNFLDSETRDAMDEPTNKFTRSLEPGLSLSLEHPTYSFSTGIRRREQWNSAHMNNENRNTNEYYYARLNLLPEALPSLEIQFDRQRRYDFVSPRSLDDNNSVYSVNSTYESPSREVMFRYTFNYSYSINNTPLNVNYKSIGDNFNGTYNIGYTGSLWQDKTYYSVAYQGNYTRNKIEQFVAQTGTIQNKRIPFAGLYVFDDIPVDPTSNALNNENKLIDNDINAPITNINIGPIIPPTSHINHNIGVWVSPQSTVDRLYIYVDRDVSGDTNLSSIINWAVYKSNSNTTWTVVQIKQVTVSFDTSNNIYRYEIIFLNEQSASYFKAVNLATVNSSKVGLTDPVYVTEIEAVGTDLADERRLVDVSNSFTQQLSLNTSVRPTSRLTLALAYSIDKSDQNMVSIIDSVTSTFENIFRDSFPDDKPNFISKITRGYSASATWLTHRFLTTSLRAQQSEVVDNMQTTDFRSNSYDLSFLTEPLPTLNASLSLIRSYSYRFSEKDTTGDSVLLSVTSKLYTDLNMITDIIYTRSHSFAGDTTTSSHGINGMLDALLTRKVSGTITYHFNRSISDGTAVDSKEGAAFISYRPGKIFNITGNIKISDTDGETSTAEGILLGWLPLPAVRLNVNYEHNVTGSGSVSADTVSSYVIWYITKFADVRLTNSYSMQVEDKKTENYSMYASLNCRF